VAYFTYKLNFGGVVMKEFIYNMIHMTQGEKLINYWWLWLILFIVVIAMGTIQRKLDADIIKLLKEIDGGNKNETKS